MTSTTLSYIWKFIALVLLQALICNNINLFGFINPYIYLIFILTYPSKNNRVSFIFLAFLLGFCVDIFSDSGGVHAAASVFTAFIRPAFLKTSFGTLYEHQTIKYGNAEFGSLLLYISMVVVSHHLVLFSMEIFSPYGLLDILKNTLLSGIFTILLSLIIIILFENKK